MSLHRYHSLILKYYEACDARDPERISQFFHPEAIHYFPAGDLFPDGTEQRAFRGAEAIGQGFSAGFTGDGRAYWRLDHIMVNDEAAEAVIEWSNFKPGKGSEARLRGAEWYRFDSEDLITEIRAYYACPLTTPTAPHELGDFDYAGRGYSTGPSIEPES